MKELDYPVKRRRLVRDGVGGAERMNSLSHEVAILALSGIIIIIITTQTPLFFQELRGKIIGFFPTNNTFTPELN